MQLTVMERYVDFYSPSPLFFNSSGSTGIRLFSPRRKFPGCQLAAVTSGHATRTGERGAVYTPTPYDRQLRTPHSGYHFDGSIRQFFEGWYFRVSIPEVRQSFCFMYAVDNPAFLRPLTPLEIAQHGSKTTGSAAQILGPDDELICQFSPESTKFWGCKSDLSLGNTFVSKEENIRPPTSELPPEEFNRRILEGFQVTPLWHQGFIRDDGRNDFAKTVEYARWEYRTRPIYGWGDVGSKQKPTAGWLASFPVFEPHWQICMAGGLSTGWIEWGGKKYEFEDAPSYSEKNWGGAFPRKWAWVQCNVFEGASGEVSLTSAVALRQLPGLSETFESVALIGVHAGGKFYEFVPWIGNLSWEIKPWGFWHISAENDSFLIEVEARTEDPGCPLRAPTIESGFSPACKDTCNAFLKLNMWERKYDGSKGKAVLELTSNMAAVEVGGGPWFNSWNAKSSSPEILNRALRIPLDLDPVFDIFPPLKPPGL